MEQLLVAGVDEVGRGPLAGPVVAAAVILDPARPIEGLRDSKKLSEKKREALVPIIQEHAIAWALGRAEVEEIDTINILQASFLAMQRAVAALTVTAHKILVDGNHAPEFHCPTEAIIGGDDSEACISAASIIAKVHRDNEMRELHELYPEYGLANHKGYGTKAHLAALAEFGATPIHRKSFAPVRRVVGV
ncbi:MAG: ribonuclease HII [Legionellales bacterium]|mgnify:CR=1 FL=1|nr:ribonuclease HII [Legionellales bacterium]